MQLNRGEGRHQLARVVFHGKRGELRQRYREGQEDQLGALGLVVNVIVLWNTIYMDAVLNQLRAEGFDVRSEDVARLSPLGSTTSTCSDAMPSSCPIKLHAANLGRCATPNTLTMRAESKFRFRCYRTPFSAAMAQPRVVPRCEASAASRNVGRNGSRGDAIIVPQPLGERREPRASRMRMTASSGAELVVLQVSPPRASAYPPSAG